VAEELEGCLATPEALTSSQIERLAAALRGNLTPLIHQVLSEHPHASLQTQWAALIPTLSEALAPETEAAPGTPTRPRRVLHLKQGLTIRRERSRGGWSLHFTGPEARSGALIDDVLDKVEEWFGGAR
jgi:ParB family transcriptional regulator, chromosome partitioning protein